MHGRVKDEMELEFIKKEGITLVSFKSILDELCQKDNFIFSTSAAGDLIEIINYYKDGFNG